MSFHQWAYIVSYSNMILDDVNLLQNARCARPLTEVGSTADLRGEQATWQRVYDWEPIDYCQAEGNATRQALILGGEAAMW
eukprot:COSAG02_NODE_538_length_20609_cov_7.009703_25_plen_81_part_00